MRSSGTPRKPNSKHPIKPQFNVEINSGTAASTATPLHADNQRDNQRDSHPHAQSLGQKIRTARLSRGLTQAQLGQDLVTPSMISQIEADRTKPSSSLLADLANRLGLPVEYFLNDLDEQFTFQTFLRQAEYELLLSRPEVALTVLEQAQSSNLQGTTKQVYNLLTAKAYRLQGRVLDAAYLIEEVREHAFLTHDPVLQFRVGQESGYLEYAMDNDVGAIHDWENALEIGQTLIEEEPQNVLLLRDTVGVCLKLSETLTRVGRLDEAQQVLGKILRRDQALSTIRDIAETFRAHSQWLIDQGNTSEAKEMIDRAITVIQTAKLTQEHVLAEATLARLNSLHQATEMDGTLVDKPKYSYDTGGPWVQTAVALVTEDPAPFLEAELIRIRQALDSEDLQAADRRIQRCFDILEDYYRENAVFERTTQIQRSELSMMSAKLAYRQGRLLEAIEIAEGVAREIRHSSRLTLILAQLIDWCAEAGEDEKVLELLTRLQNLLK